MKGFNRSFNFDDPDHYKLPETRSLAADYLLAFEMSAPSSDILSSLLNTDRSATLFSVSIHKSYSNDLLALAESAEQWIRDNYPEKLLIGPGVGTDIAFANISKENTRSMMWGTLCAFLIISSLITLITRSITFGSISLIANTLPALAAFGVWGLTVAEIGMATSTVVCIAIGIIVDDTVHFIEHYRNARVVQGLSSGDAIRYAYQHAGLAIMLTSIILAAGFLILGGSPFSATADTGNLIALTITAALLFDLLMVPAVILLLDKKHSVKTALGEREEISVESGHRTDTTQEVLI